MNKLNNDEMLNVVGGGIAKNLIYGIIGGTLVFLIGFFDGIINPSRCN